MIIALTLLALVISAALVVSLQRRMRAAQRLQRRNEAAVAELQLVTQIRGQISAGQSVAENVVAGGTNTVRAVHKGIASIPFGILESIPVTRDTTRVVRLIHDAISDGVYGGISATNKVLHQVARNAASSALKSDGASGPKELPKDPTNKSK
ncbi:hypothetical protein [Stenotrophobium rhamnosiphilum]|uniref:Uncharacterized protein n=1 Tax=Stenotrophobium rhamnosiphilum TaxID=2029166 RepID=A0A2T5MGF7_9GAMM|nr:hypothetical protein [Stenotrophobium rhamnosiphilum]PTU31652.1 hypothetical protein CJD38_10065 [Stenotrophobium rhamnosiphilum]